jgi:hypothetical protein
VAWEKERGVLAKIERCAGKDCTRSGAYPTIYRYPKYLGAFKAVDFSYGIQQTAETP